MGNTVPRVETLVTIPLIEFIGMPPMQLLDCLYIVKRSLFWIVLLSILVAGCSSNERSGRQIIVGAAISLQSPLEQIASRYRASHPGADVVFSFAGSGTIAHQIRFGAPIDLFFPAAQEYIDSLVLARVLLPEFSRPLVANHLVLIQPARRLPIGSVTDLTLPSVSHIAVGEPSTVPAGRYAVEALRMLGLYDQVRPKLVFAKDVRQALVYVETGVVDAGFVYKTDALTSRDVRIVATVADSLHRPIQYGGGVVARSAHLRVAQDFFAYVQSDTAAAIFATYGFSGITP